MVGRLAAFAASMLSEPPTAVHAPALNRLTWTSSFVPFDSAQATNGTPFTLVRAGSLAFFAASMLSEPSTVVHAPTPRRSTWTSSLAPFDSAHATNGTPPIVVMLVGLIDPAADLVGSMLSDPANGSLQSADAVPATLSASASDVARAVRRRVVGRTPRYRARRTVYVS